MLAVKSGSKHEGAKHINVAELSDEPFITMSEKSSMYEITESICRDFGFKPKIAMQSDDPFYVRKGVELGLGVSFVPNFSWQAAPLSWSELPISTIRMLVFPCATVSKPI